MPLGLGRFFLLVAPRLWALNRANSENLFPVHRIIEVSLYVSAKSAGIIRRFLMCVCVLTAISVQCQSSEVEFL